MTILLAVSAVIGLVGLLTIHYRLTMVWEPSFSTISPLLSQIFRTTTDSFSRTQPRISYGRFPLPGDPFSFIPCPNASVPPPLGDSNPAETWAALFDLNPENWSWGSPTLKSSSDAGEYSARGIYLCGYFDLPLDYFNDSDNRIVRLAVAKFQVSGLARIESRGVRISPSAGRKSERTIIVEPGGPGESGTSYVWQAAEEVSERFSNGRFDVFGWDPRGVNISLPAVACFPYNLYRDHWSLLRRQYREVTTPMTQLKLADAMNNATFYACRERLGDLGRFVSTATVARDLEEIRKALDEDQLTGYFISYGTGIGQTYANMFPDHVGRMILDGLEYVKDHRLLGGFGWTSLDNATDVWRDGFLGECLRAGSHSCALAKPARGQNRSVTLAKLEARMDVLLKSLITRPLPGYTERSGPSLVTYSALVASLYTSMYDPRTWRDTAQMLYELEDGNHTLAATFLDRSWEYDPARSSTFEKPSSSELPYIVICADAFDAPPTRGGPALVGESLG